MIVVATKRRYGRFRRRKRIQAIFGAIVVLLIVIAAISGVCTKNKVQPAGGSVLVKNLGSEKTNIGLANFAWNALDCKSGYVYGGVGQTITPVFLSIQAQRFHGNSRANLTGSELNRIYSAYAGHPAFDCMGLIKAYSWIDEKTGKISHTRKNAMPDWGANEIMTQAAVYGAAAFMPEIPGLAVQMPGHIGVYVGNGEVIEAQSNHTGVIKTKFKGRGWKWYVMVPTLTYVNSGTYSIHGQPVTITNGKAVKSNVVPDIFDMK